MRLRSDMHSHTMCALCTVITLYVEYSSALDTLSDYDMRALAYTFKLTHNKRVEENWTLCVEMRLKMGKRW